METFTNLGPIVDMCVVDLERQGQGQVRQQLQCRFRKHNSYMVPLLDCIKIQAILRNDVKIKELFQIYLEHQYRTF